MREGSVGGRRIDELIFRGPVEAGEIVLRACTDEAPRCDDAGNAEVIEDPANHDGIGQEGEDLQTRSAPLAVEHVDFVDALEQVGPR